MTRRKAKTKRIFLSVFLAIALCLFALAGCQSAGCENTVSPDEYGRYLGKNIDECYEAFGFDPETDMEIIEGPDIRATTKEPVNYLGKEFIVTIAHITGHEGAMSFYNDRLDFITYTREYKDVPDETVAKEIRELLRAMYDKYGDCEGNGAEALRNMLESEETDENSFIPDINLEWMLPEEAEKIDPEVVKVMEENWGEMEYRVKCEFNNDSGHYVFMVRHVYGRSYASLGIRIR